MKLFSSKLMLFFAFLFVFGTDGCIENSFDRHQSQYPLAEDQGLNGKALEWMVEEINNGAYGQVNSLAISRNGVLVMEEYFNGVGQDSLQRVYSVTKSIMSTLIGTAYDRGEIASLEAYVIDYFPEYTNLEYLGVYKRSMTIRHLLNMAAGLDWNELAVPYSDESNIFNFWAASDDRVRFVLDRPMVGPPGTSLNYNTGVSHLLSAILTKSTGQSASEYAEEHLFGPLGIEDWYWPSYDGAISTGGTGLRLRTLDMLRFGQLYLQQGNWEGTQLVSETWVSEATDSLGIMSEYTNYGYQWWNYSSKMIEIGLVTSPGIYLAIGYGGQIIWVIPEHNLVIVMTSSNGDDFQLSERIMWHYLSRMVNK